MYTIIHQKQKLVAKAKQNSVNLLNVLTQAS